MKTTGIIAEYNPFHNGHLYQMQQARILSGADYIIVIMSPDFVQRGAPALMDKWVRARMALEAGADLVLELPVRYAAGSAEYFARGGISLLSSLGVVSAVSFGCETDDITPLEEYADFLCQEEPEDYRTLLQSALKNGKSFAEARCTAYLAYRYSLSSSGQIPVPGFSGSASSPGRIPAPGFTGPGAGKPGLSDLLHSPNNILAIEYLKAIRKLNSPLVPVPVLRAGNGYHERSMPRTDCRSAERSADISSGSISGAFSAPADALSFASASGIRNALSEGADVREQMPPHSYALLQEELSQNRFLSAADLDLPLHLKLAEAENRGSLSEYLDVSEDLANRIEHLLPQYQGFEQFAMLLKTRQMTYTRICRALIHILLNIKNESGRCLFPSYARVLGFRKKARPLLSEIKQHSSVPLVTKLPPERQLSGSLREDLLASHLWETLVSHKAHSPVRNERQRQILILS